MSRIEISLIRKCQYIPIQYNKEQKERERAYPSPYPKLAFEKYNPQKRQVCIRLFLQSLTN
jgi:hypothetical protein